MIAQSATKTNVLFSPFRVGAKAPSQGFCAPSSFITDMYGYAEQHVQYLPFGELFVNQQNTSFDTRYKFTAKEHDQESNYTNFGVRYLDSDGSFWLSVDPMADKFSNTSPFMYCVGNPVKLIDPNGMDTILFNSKGYFREPIEDNNNYDTYIKANSNEFSTNKIDYRKNGNLRNRHKPMRISKDFYSSGHLFWICENTHAYELFDYNEAKSVFEYFSNNTDVEWSHSIGTKDNSYEIYNILTTSHSKEYVISPNSYYVSKDGFKIVDQRHSHQPQHYYSNDDKVAYKQFLEAGREVPMFIYKNFKYYRFNSEKIFVPSVGGTILPNY